MGRRRRSTTGPGAAGRLERPTTPARQMRPVTIHLFDRRTYGSSLFHKLIKRLIG